MARPRAVSSNSFEDLVITGLGQLSHDTIGKCLVSFIVMLCVWTFIVHWGIVFAVMWNAHALLAVLATAFHHVLHGYASVCFPLAVSLSSKACTQS